MSESALLSHQVSSIEERASAASKRTNSLRRVFAIARNSFREAVRDRVLYNLVLFVLLLTGAAVFVGDLSAGSEAKIIVDVGLSATLLFGAFIAIFVGIVGIVFGLLPSNPQGARFDRPQGAR